ncbi:MAG TPA: DUF1579 domain-containing protein [Longimicrobiales bacterium]|nr:DUF1579 domain-containing protein [Longimicrobiales bacterium]
MGTSATEQQFVPATPQEEHRWLERLAGDWNYEAEAIEPGKPPQRSTGSESVRTLGGLWYIAEGQGEMPGGGAATTIMTLGYDPATGRYVGSWVGSMMTHMWVYDGVLTADGLLELHAEGPTFDGSGNVARYKDVIEFRSDDHRLLTSHVQGSDGEWQQFMTAHYRRLK